MENLNSDRLIIRKFNSDDWKDLYEYLSDPDVVEFEPYEPYTVDGAKEEAARRSNDDNFYAVCLKESGKLIGNLYFARGDFDTWEIGYVFNKKYQHKGYAYESANTLINYAFSNWDVRRIIALCSDKNLPSWKLMERLNMRREGLFRQNVFFKRDKDGQPIWYDSYEYALLKSEWNK